MDLLNVLEADDDAEIWKKIYLSAKCRVFSMSILIKFLEKFENLSRGKRYFMSIINASVVGDGDGRSHLEDFVMDEGQFSMVFGTMFSDILKSWAMRTMHRASTRPLAAVPGPGSTASEPPTRNIWW